MTDFRHPVLLASQLALAQLLTQCPVRGEADLCRGLLAAAALGASTLPARRFAPELAAFVQSALCVLAGARLREGEDGGGGGDGDACWGGQWGGEEGRGYVR